VTKSTEAIRVVILRTGKYSPRSDSIPRIMIIQLQLNCASFYCFVFNLRQAFRVTLVKSSPHALLNVCRNITNIFRRHTAVSQNHSFAQLKQIILCNLFDFS